MTDTLTVATTSSTEPPGGLLPERWQPARAGLVNAWRYQDEVLSFHRGRLLLRGPNGSGKSMALELLLPFLLDASASQHRLSSAARSRGGLYERLLGDDAASTGKVAFLWLELHRGSSTGDTSSSADDDGVDAREVGEVARCTIGVRLRASASTRRVDKLWFVTPQRIGEDLALLDEGRVPLAAAALTERVEAGGGRTFDDDGAYRRRVRETLYAGFSEDQYDAVIAALLALRQERLSQHLDLERLSATLSSALPSLDEAEIADAAEGFRQLDQRREHLEQLAADRDAVDRLRRRQRAYARAELRARAGEMVAAESERSGVASQTTRHEAELDEVRERDEVLAAEDTERLARLGELRGHLDALHQRDAYLEGSTIEALRSETRRAQDHAQNEVDRSEHARRRSRRALDQADEAVGMVEVAARHVDEAHTGLAASADRTGASTTLEAAGAEPPDEAGRLLAAFSDGRRTQLAAVRDALDALSVAVRDRGALSEQREEATAAREDRRAQSDAARTDLEDATRALREALSTWVTGLARLDAERLTDLAALDEPQLLEIPARIAEVAAEQREALTAADAELAARQDTLRAERDEVAAHRDRLAASPEPELPAPDWRRDRDDVAGAPLWRLLDVRDDVEGATAGRIEAALAACGLLDAWVRPDGGVELAEGEADVFATPGAGAGAGAGAGDRTAPGADPGAPPGPARSGPASLASVLRPEQAAPVGTDAIAALLETVAVVDDALDDGEAAARPGWATLGRDGSFRVGPLAGRGPEGEAGYLGATARERRRRRQLAELDARLADLDDRHTELADQRAALTEQRRHLDLEVAGAPDTAALEGARTAATLAVGRLDDAEQRVVELDARHTEADDRVRARQRTLTATAAPHGLPTGTDRLDELDAALRRLEAQTVAWVGRRRELEAKRAAAEQQRHAAEDAQTHATELDEQATTASRAHRELQARLDALERTVGAAYREVVAEIETAETERDRLEGRAAAIGDARRAISGDIGRLEQALATAANARERAETRRARAQQALVGVLRDGFDADADVAIEGTAPTSTEAGVSAALSAARDLARHLEDVDGRTEAVTQTHDRVGEHRHLTAEQLGGRADLSSTMAPDGWWLLRARIEGRSLTVTELRTQLADDLATAHAELAEHERELYDRTLTEGLRRHLVARIRNATELTDRINRQLRRVSTEAGVAVQLDWVVDDADDHGTLAAARPLLLKAPADLTREQTDALHAFLRARIELVRDPQGDEIGWEGRLLQAFDYRAWHRFRLKVSHDRWGGEFRVATSNRLQQLSTGERSVVLHLPMLASIAAHYDADEQGRCPRLILLDELFVGVDPVNRAKLFGMFTTWDLDAVLTSDHEWCRYASLDGIAIHQVHGDADPVVTTRFVWDGAQRRAVPSDG